MKMNRSEWFRKMQLLLAVILATYPLHWLISAWLDSSRIGTVWLFSAAVMLVGGIVLVVPGKLRPVIGIAVCLMLFAGSFLPDTTNGKWLWFLASVLSCVQIFWSLPLASSDNKTELPGYWISVGITTHVTTQVLLLTDWAVELPGWMLRLSFFGYVLIVMLSVDRHSLVVASGKRKAVPAGLKRRNMLLTVALFGISLLGGLLPSAIGIVKDVIVEGLRWMGDMVEKLLSRVSGDAANAAQQTASEVPQVGPAGGQMRQLPPVLETIILYIGAAISVAFLAMILFRTGKKLVRFVRGSWDLLGKFLSASSEDYVDEVTDIRDTGSAEHIIHKKRRRIRYKDDPSLSPGERVRRRYQFLRHDHSDWLPGATAREKLPGRAADIYEHARYSERTISDEDAKRFIDIAKHL